MTRSTTATDWNALITAAVTDPDAARSNRKITSLHYRLSLALCAVTGSAAGANFHTWAVWGSNKAGESIRREGLARAKRDAALAGGGIGFALGFLLAGWFGGFAAAVALAAVGVLFVRHGEKRAARLILAGNRLVIDEIGRVTARFVATFRGDRKPDEAKLQRFLATIDTDPRVVPSGRLLLRQAFAHYYLARFAATRPARQEAACLANCLAVYHEHLRLQPYIAGALPWGLRRYATARFMQFRIGRLSLNVTANLANAANEPALGVDPVAWNLLFGPNGVAQRPGTAARDWSDLNQRMDFVTALFRTFHNDAEVFANPEAANGWRGPKPVIRTSDLRFGSLVLAR